MMKSKQAQEMKSAADKLKTEQRALLSVTPDLDDQMCEQKNFQKRDAC